jgi:hypothetical protein
MIWYIPTAIGIAAIVIFILATLMVKTAERKLRANRRQLVSTLKDYICLLRVYRNYLLSEKDKGMNLDREYFG